MIPSNYEMSTAIILMVVAVLLVAWFLIYKAAGTQRRMQNMLRLAGLDPDIDINGDHETLIKAIRLHCKKCQAEDVCERWLAGDIAGDNGFCPNAKIIEILAGEAKRAA